MTLWQWFLNETLTLLTSKYSSLVGLNRLKDITIALELKVKMPKMKRAKQSFNIVPLRIRT